ncbi:MAG: ribosome silencing factor [Fibrobacteria bacterium]|nr:ribosome silencing factor [Fibrobacteria bacterium]
MNNAIKNTDSAALLADNPLLQKSIQALFSYKVVDPVLIDLREVSTITDEFLVVCTCQSEVQMKSVLNNIKKLLSVAGVKQIRLDYSPGVKWAILVCEVMILHIFEKNTRVFYSLERIWGDVPIISLTPELHALETEEAEDDREYI